jgi:hypothetical protein
MDDVTVTELPLQNDAGPLNETTGIAGNGFTVIPTDAVTELHPLALVI